MQKLAIFHEIKKIKELRGVVQKWYAAQLIPQIDEEIVEKGYFWLETKLL